MQRVGKSYEHGALELCQMVPPLVTLMVSSALRPDTDSSQSLRVEPHFVVVQAVILVLRGLELDTLLGLLAEGERLDVSGLALRSVAARREMDSELCAWGACTVPAHAPVLLAWAAFAALSSKMEDVAGPDGARIACVPGISKFVSLEVGLPHWHRRFGYICMFRVSEWIWKAHRPSFLGLHTGMHNPYPFQASIRAWKAYTGFECEDNPSGYA